MAKRKNIKNILRLVLFLLFATGIFLFTYAKSTDHKAVKVSAGGIDITSAAVEPFKIKVGETQTTTVSVKSDVRVEKVSARIPFEGSSDEIVLTLIKGNDKDGTWEGKWTCHNTLSKEYTTTITVTDVNGKTAQRDATWWDDVESVWLQGWVGRERVVVTETSGSTLTNNKTSVTVPYRGDMQADFDDIRFTAADGNTLLGYYLASKTDSTTATFWVNIPSLPASADTSIYYYFGNPDVTTLSDVANSPPEGGGPFYWTETSNTDLADGTHSGTQITGSGDAGSATLGPDANSSSYENSFSVTNTVASNLTGYQVLLTMDTASLITAGKLQSDCDDLRFFENDGTTVVPYWVSSGCNTSSTTIYIKTNLSSSATKTIKVRYGNSGMAKGSNGSNVFLFFDDFDSLTSGTLGSWVKQLTGAPTNTTAYAATDAIINSQIMETTVSNSGAWVTVNLYTARTGLSIPAGTYVYDFALLTGYGVSMDGNSKASIKVNGTERYSGLNTANAWQQRSFTYNSASTITSLAYGQWGYLYTAGPLFRYDNVRLRQSIASEPTYTLGSESALAYIYATAGNYISSTFDVGAQSKMSSIAFSVTTPANTAIKFQVAGNNDNATWSFLGPNGTGTDYYTANSSTFASALSGNRFLRYKAYLETTDTATTPSMDSLTLGYLSYSTPSVETTTTEFNDGTLANVAVNNGSMTLTPLVSMTWSRSSSWDILTTSTYALPSFADLDNDGDLDAMLGVTDGIAYGFRNIGSATVPSWEAVTGWNTASVGTQAAPYLADMDGDGDFDMMIGSGGGIVYGLKNTGSSSSPVWTEEIPWRTVDIGSFSVPAIADLDNDGLKDLMIGENLGITKGYRNSGTASNPSWTATTAWNTLDLGTDVAPALADLDGDGDFDMMIGDSLVNVIYSFTNTGTVSSPTWTTNAYWGAPYNITAPGPALVDMDNDGDKDLMIGNYDGDAVGYLSTPATEYPSSGTYVSSALDMSTTSKIDSLFFNATVPVGYATLKFQVAVNNDNSTWNFIGTDSTASTYFTASSNLVSPHISGYRYVKYKAFFDNNDTSYSPTLSDVTINNTKIWQQTTTADFSGGALTGVVSTNNSVILNGSTTPDPTWTATSGWNTTDLGTYVTSELADLDNDGDLDMLAGLTGGDSLGYRNDGGASGPPSWVANAGWNLTDIGARAAPAFADLDGDGDKDIMVGSTTGPIYAYNNTGSASAPTWTDQASPSWDTVDMGAQSAPAMADLDNDGKIDLLSGESTGLIKAYRNTGTTANPTWTAAAANWGIAVSIGTYTHPTLKDIDGDGDFDMIIGSGGGITYAYKNTGSVSSPTWTATSAWNIPANSQTYSAPSMGDLDNDGYPDILMGTNGGVCYGYKNVRTYPTSGNLVSSAFDATASAKFGFIYFNKTTPANTLVKFHLATNDDNATWSFTGPDDTGTTYYTTDAQSTSLTLNAKRYIKYKAYLETTNTATTPILADMSIGYVMTVITGATPTVNFTTQGESRPRPSGSTGVSGGSFLQF